MTDKDQAAGARPAPRGLIAMMMASGPGIVVAGSVMGSGELINTPYQAAQFGFVLLWAVILSCLIKYFLQVEIARYCLVHNRTTIEALNHCPGPKVRGTSWIGLVFMFGYTISLLGLVGIVGATAGLLHTSMPLAESTGTSVSIWAVILVLVTQLLLWKSLYGHLEMLVAMLVGGFSLSVVAGLVLVQGSEFRISWHEVQSGLTFSLGDTPRLAAYAVISLIGALGTTANEMFMYPYWVLEKGYAQSIGSSDSEGWLERAKGWVRVLQIDAGLATLLATVVTTAYFLLGATIFYRQGLKPEGFEVVEKMSQIYTQTYGSWSYSIFVIGAFCTLFSTLIVATAATGRMWADLLCSMGYVDRENERSIHHSHQAFQTIYLVGVLLAVLFMQKEPASLVIFAQYFSGLFNTPLLMFGICWLAFHTDRRLRMSGVTAGLLITSVITIVTCVGIGLAVQSGLLAFE